MRRFLAVLALIFGFCATQVVAQSITSSAGVLQVEKVMGGLTEPWSLAFLPDGGFLITERAGRLVHVSPAGQRNNVSGVPRVFQGGQGGLLDVAVALDFQSSRMIFLSYAKPQGAGAGTALVRGLLSQDGHSLLDVTQIFEMTRGSSGGRHFGSRIVLAADGTIFLTIGERGDRPAAQDLSRHNGSVARINPDGTIPGTNPLVGQSGAAAEIWSYGHRNPQGAALDLQGRLWVTEHGAKGGDEVNLIQKGANFGWPVISYGQHYSGAKIGEGTAKAGMQQPAHFWDPSIAPSGLMIYSGKLWPQWRGDFFIGSLKFNYISRLAPDQGWREEKLQSNRTGRVRDIREAPDGTIWFLSVKQGAVFRISPK